MAEKSMEEEIDGTKSWQDENAPEAETTKEPEKEPEEVDPKKDVPDEGEGKPEGGEDRGPEKKGETEETPQKENKEDRKDYFKDGHTPQGIQKRFSEFSRKVRGLEDENASLKAELEKLKAANREPPKTREQYANDEEWVNGLVDSRVGDAVSQAITRERERSEMEKSIRTFEGNESGFREKVADYDEVMGSDVGRLDVDRETMKYVFESPVGPMIQYTLKKIPEVRDSFLAVPVANRGAVVRNIERRLLEIQKNSSKPAKAEEPKPAEQPKAEPPKAPVIKAPQQTKASPSKILDPATCSMEEWMDNGD